MENRMNDGKTYSWGEVVATARANVSYITRKQARAEPWATL